MKKDLIISKNDARLCIQGTENLWSVCRVYKSGNNTVKEVVAENIEHAEAVLFSAAPELLAALQALLATAELVDAGNKRYVEESYGFASSLFEHCRAVIAKATTESAKP